ncbi:MAG: hypothetical protein ACYTF6_13290 [Planctomycetota bacterium]
MIVEGDLRERVRRELRMPRPVIAPERENLILPRVMVRDGREPKVVLRRTARFPRRGRLKFLLLSGRRLRVVVVVLRRRRGAYTLTPCLRACRNIRALLWG